MKHEYVTRLLREGDVILIEPQHTVYAFLPEHFVYGNRKGVFDKFTKTDIEVGNNALGDDYFTGKYIVTKVASDGGGTGHGPHDVYPNGHHVWAERIPNNDDDPEVKIDFYQTGSFTAMIPAGEVMVVGKAERTWKVKT